jgi:diguanylate cyclase (GGDEF)-like protein
MNQDAMIDIVGLCMSIEDRAAGFYRNLKESAEKDDVRKFWQRILDQGRGRKAGWEQLETWARSGMLPQFFDLPSNVRTELATIRSKVDVLLDSSRRVEDLRSAIFMAFKLEFYLLHPAFESFFQYLRTVTENSGMAGTHETINLLFEALEIYGLEALELELLGETLHRLWQENRKMAIQSNTDPLTGVLNRRGFFDAIKPLSHLAQRNGSDIAILMIDIDHFKKINDTHGHQFGDAVLRYVAETLMKNIRTSDLLGRYGGEEFIIILSSVTREALFDVAEKLRAAVEADNRDNGNVTISVGAAISTIGFPVEGEMERLIRDADTLLLKAKSSGRNRTML